MNTHLTPEQRSEILLTNILKSDCGIIALQAVTGWSRARSEKLASKHGWSLETGIRRGAIDGALRSIGFTVRHIPVDNESNYQQETAAEFAMRCDYGAYLVYTERHVMALIDGDLHNSRGHWGAPVEAAVRVERPSKH